VPHFRRTLLRFVYYRCHLTNLCPKLTGCGDNCAGKMWSCCDSSTVPVEHGVLKRTLRRFGLEPIAEPSHTEASVLCKVLGTLGTIFMKLVRSVAQCVYDSQVLIGQVLVLTLQELQIPPRFKCIW